MARPSRALFPVTVEQTTLVTPHMKRIAVDGTGLSPYRGHLPAQFIKVFVPTKEGRAEKGRAYTVRRFHEASKRLELDFVLHGDDGVVSAWAASACAGDTFEISGVHPRSGLSIEPATTSYLLAGDETALPAIGAILEALPQHARADVLVEVADEHEEQELDSRAAVDVTWVHRGRGGNGPAPLVAAVRASSRPDPGTLVWVAGESSTVRAIREQVTSEWGIGRERLHAVAYWKRGESNHKDDDAIL